MVSVEIPAPRDLPEDRYKEWFSRVSDIMIGFFGGPQNLIEGFIHVDEIHDYVNAETGMTVRSRAHGHFCGVPEIDGTLNAKRLTSRANIIKINSEVDAMSRKEFGCFFMTGEKKKDFHTVEELKEISAYAEYEMKLTRQKEKLEEQREQLRILREALDRRQREIEEKEENARRIHEEAEEMYREAVRLEQEAREKMDDAEQLQEEMRRRRAASAELGHMGEKWGREGLGWPTPTTEQRLREAAEIRRRHMEDEDNMGADDSQEARSEKILEIPFYFRGLVPSDDEMEF